MQGREVRIYQNDNNFVSEAYAVLRANILFNDKDSKIKTISIVSCNPGEGKTTVSINLAMDMARTGIKVLLIDTDLRKPSAYKSLGEEEDKGLSDYLQDDLSLDNIISGTNVKNLNYISCGTATDNASGLLMTPKFNRFSEEIRNKYDIIVIDTPALFSVIDGAIIASTTDATLVVAKYNSTTKSSLKRLKDQLEQSKANVLGVILNNVNKREYKTYYQSYNYFKNKRRFKK